MKLEDFKKKLHDVLTDRITNVAVTEDGFDVGGVQVRPATYKDRDEVLWIFIEYRIDGKRSYSMVHVKESGRFKTDNLFVKVMDSLREKITKENRKRVNEAVQISTINGFQSKVLTLKRKHSVSLEVQTLPAPDGSTAIMFTSIEVMDRILDLLSTHGPTQ